MGIQIIQTSDPLNDPAVLAVRNRLRGGQVMGTGDAAAGLDVPGIVRGIIADVVARGDQAVIDATAKVHQVTLTPQTLRVSPEQIAQAHQAAEKKFLRLARRVIANIRRYQQRILIKAPRPLKRGGRELGVRYTPVDRVGLYVPGGRAVYPSSMLMAAVPAQVAGVGQIAVASPPTTDGDVNPMILAIAGELGIAEVYRSAGVPALAALAVGTETIRPVDKIMGPGNAFIAEAKRQLLGRVGIDSIAGPSEVLIVADDAARADWVAADMLAQAEHDPGSAVLVTNSMRLAQAVAAQLDAQVARLKRAAATAAGIEQNSAIIVTPDIASACKVANDFATEHLQIVTAQDEEVLKMIRHAGAIFVGPHTPVPLGDYYAGPSHILPTGGTARFFSPLSCNDFLKASSVIRYDAASLAADGKDVIDFATREGLTAHAEAIRIRMGD